MLLNVESSATYTSNLFFLVSDCRLSHTHRAMPDSDSELKTIIYQIDIKKKGLVWRLHQCRQKGHESRANTWDRRKYLKPGYSIHKKKEVMLRKGGDASERSETKN